MPDLSAHKHVVALISEYGNSSVYEAMLASSVMSLKLPIDWLHLTGGIKPKDWQHTSYFIHAIWDHLPPHSIVLCAIDTDITQHTYVYLAQRKDVYICTFSTKWLTLGRMYDDLKLIRIPLNTFNVHPAFPELAVFTELVAHIVKQTYTVISESISFEAPPHIPDPAVSEQMIRAKVIHVDGHQNLITDLSKSVFEEIMQRYTHFEIRYSRKYKINKLVTAYGEGIPGDIVALFNRQDLLEIAMVDGDAAQLLGMHVGSTILIECI